MGRRKPVIIKYMRKRDSCNAGMVQRGGMLGTTCDKGGVTDLHRNLHRNGACPTGTSLTQR